MSLSSKKRPFHALSTDAPRPAVSSLRTNDFDVEATRMELEAVKAELEHERSLRALEARRAQQTKARLEQHLELALNDARETKEVLEETQQENQIHFEQLRDARNDVLRQLRQAQKQLMESDTASLIEEADAVREKHQLLESRLSAVTEEAESLRRKLLFEQQRSQESDKEENEADSPGEKIFETSGSLAPTAVLKELNRTRLLLAESERKYRQLVRKSDDWHQKSKQCAQQQQAARMATTRIDQLETQLRNETKEIEALRAENKGWTAFRKNLDAALRTVDNGAESARFGGSTAGQPPETARIFRVFEQLQTENRHLQKEKESLESDLHTCQQRISSLENGLQTATKEKYQSEQNLRDIESQLKQVQFDLETLRAQEGIWKREADSLRSLMKTYNDEAVSASSTTSAGVDSSLRKARDEIRLLEEERSRMLAQVKTLQAQQEELEMRNKQIMEKFGRLKEALVAEKQKADDAEARACKAASLTGMGHFNSEETRVLHLKQNPQTEAIQQRYEQEITALKKQLQETTGDKSVEGKPSSVAQEVDPQKLHKRLKESFKEQIGLFREGVYLMTGYKVDMLPKTDRPTFRVRSVYAEREHDHLLFVWPKGSSDVASLDLVETEQAKELAATDSYAYMTKFNSVPAFLASVQLSLFEKQTIA